MSVTREKLYEDVWAEPMRTVAARYEVSGSYLARICRELRIPHPERGYWARMRAGYKVTQPPLPEVQPGDPLEWSNVGEARTAARALPEPPTADERPAEPRFRRWTRHPLVAGIQQYFDAARVTDVGYLRPLKRLMVDIYVTRESLPHAMRTAGKAFLALENRGHRVVLAPRDEHFCRPDLAKSRSYHDASWDKWRPATPTVVYVGTVAFGLSLFEISEDVECRYVHGEWVKVGKPRNATPGLRTSWNDWTSTRRVPTGRLALRAFAPYRDVDWEAEWEEKKHGDLVANAETIADELEQAAAPVAKLVAKAAKEAEERRLKWEAERRELERQEAERRRKEAEQRRQEAIKASREQLVSIIDAWVLAGNVDAFFENAMRRAADLGEGEKEALLQRLDRARALFGGTDVLQYFRAWKAPEERTRDP
jgi:Skp family chaperone for outer membrane proteins